MRYLISSSFKDEASARINYIFDTMGLWVTQHKNPNGSIMLESIPPDKLDIFFIVGHNTEVTKFIKKNIDSIYESQIIAITCNSRLRISIAKKYGKKVFISRQNNSYCNLLDGDLYGFDFNPTESEIIFYNNHHLEVINERITKAFEKKI